MPRSGEARASDHFSGRSGIEPDVNDCFTVSLYVLCFGIRKTPCRVHMYRRCKTHSCTALLGPLGTSQCFGLVDSCSLAEATVMHSLSGDQPHFLLPKTKKAHHDGDSSRHADLIKWLQNLLLR